VVVMPVIIAMLFSFAEAIDHPLVNILMATIEGWQEAN
jgi:hypothetical protein